MSTVADRVKELEFELDWAKRKLDQSIQSFADRTQENDELRGMLEAFINQFDHYSLGDHWMPDDQALVREVRNRLEELE